MKTIEYHDIKARDGWQDESIIPEDERTLDKMQWQDEETGLPCLLVRNGAGNWCGYVGVTQGHPIFGMPYRELYGSAVYEGEPEYFNADQRRMLGEVDHAAHGGITFTDYCAPSDKEHGICHLVEDGEDDKVWWFGFDCGHGSDRSPSYNFEHGGTYRTKGYVQDRCRAMAKVLRAQS